MAAETPDSSMMPFLDRVAPTQRISTSIGRIVRPPTTIAANGGVVGDGVDDRARNLGAVVDDLQRRHDELGGAHHVVDARARSLQILAHDEGQFDLEPRLQKGVGADLRAVVVEGVIEDAAVVRLGHLRGHLHGARGQADLVADHAGTLGDPRLGPEVLDAVGVLDLHVGEGAAELRDGFPLGLGAQDVLGRAAAFLFGQHGGLSCSARAPRR